MTFNSSARRASRAVGSDAEPVDDMREEVAKHEAQLAISDCVAGV